MIISNGFFSSSDIPGSAIDRNLKLRLSVEYGGKLMLIAFISKSPAADNRPTDLAFWKISIGHISATGHPIHFMFGFRLGFSGSADRMALLPVGANPRWRSSVVLVFFECPYFCNGSCDSLRVWFYDRLFGSEDRTSLFPVRPNPRWRPSAVLYNFE